MLCICTLLNAHTYSLLLSSSKTTASEWKPSFLSNEEFLHLMLESVDGFVLIVNVCENGRIMYVSEGITWLLGHVPNTLIEQNVSIFDVMAEEDVSSFKAALTEKISDNDEVVNSYDTKSILL